MFQKGLNQKLICLSIAAGFSTAASAEYTLGDGLQYGSDSDWASVNVSTRFQMRYVSDFDDEPLEADDFINGDDTKKFSFNRSRIKAEGHVYKPWLKYFTQFELGDGFFLDYGIAIEKYDWLNFKVGQWKLEYSRERVISSGKQQMLDRSIINRMFTIDRHNAASVYGRFNQDTLADISYWAGVGSGNGRGNGLSGDGKPLYFGRIQWNPLGGGVDWTASDLESHDEPALSIAYSRSVSEGAFTRFSSSGGGQLDWWRAEDDQINHIRQFNYDVAFMYRGFSAQAEYHEKRVTTDAQPGISLRGYYVQGGYFLHNAFDWIPKQLEIAGRYATYDQSKGYSAKKNEEQAVALNWFFAGHDSKITLDYTRFDLNAETKREYDDDRVRLQYDVSF